MADDYSGFIPVAQLVQPEDQPAFKPIPTNPGSLRFGTLPLQNIGEPARIPVGPADLLRTFGYGNVPSSDVSRGNVFPTNPIPPPVTEMPGSAATPVRQNIPSDDERVMNVYYDTATEDPNASDIRNNPAYRSHI